MDLLEPFAGVETGTGLADAGEVAVTEDLGIGEVDAEATEQFFHGDLLSFGTGVGRTTLGIESAFVADAYAVLIEVEGVGAYFVLGSAGVEGAVAGDVVVVADAAIATGLWQASSCSMVKLWVTLVALQCSTMREMLR